MLKKITKLACLTCFALSGSLIADQQMQQLETQESEMQTPKMFNGGFTVGTALHTSAAGSSSNINVGYINNWFLFDVGFNYLKQIDSSSNQNEFNFASHLGLRNRLYRNLFMTYGAYGSVATRSHSQAKIPFAAGPFVGLDLQVARHFLISAKTGPYVYQRTGDGAKYNEVFTATSFNLAYVF